MGNGGWEVRGMSEAYKPLGGSIWRNNALGLTPQPVYMMNMERHQAAADPQPWPNDPGCESACRLPEVLTIAIYYYYSARKLILILPSHGV